MSGGRPFLREVRGAAFSGRPKNNGRWQGSHFRAIFPDISNSYQNPALTGDITVANKAWHNWISNPFDWWENQLNFAVWCLTAECGVSYEDHFQVTDSEVSTFFTRTTPQDGSSTSCASSFPEISLMSGTRTLTMPRSTSGSAPSSECHLTLTGGRRWTMGVKAFAVIAGTWSRRAPTATRTKPKDRSAIRWTPFAIRGTSHEPGRPSSSTIRTVSLKRAWSASTTAYGRMFGPSWGRNPRPARTFSRPGWGSTPRSNFCRRCHCLSRRHPGEHRTLPENVAVCSNPAPPPPPPTRGLRLWIGLYLAPSDMELHLGTFQGYNNEVRIAVSDAGISHNPGINESEPIGPGAGTTGRKIAPPAGTVHRGPQADVPFAVPEKHVSSSSMGTKTAPSSAAEQQQRRKQVAAHEKEKVALVTAGIVLGLLALWRR